MGKLVRGNSDEVTVVSPYVGLFQNKSNTSDSSFSTLYSELLL